QDFTLSAQDQAKTIKSVTFQQAGGSKLDVFALSGVSLPAAVTGFANSVNVTANSTIEVPTIATSLGAVSVKAGATLTVTGKFPLTIGGSTVTPPTTIPGAATQFSVTTSVTSTPIGKAVTFTVSALDAAGALAANYAGTVKFSSSDTAATLPANVKLT